MRFANRAICAGGLGFAVSVLVACGSSGSLLSSGQSGELTNQLAAVSRSLSNHQCSQAASELSTLQNTVNNLGSVDQTLVSNLNQGASTIQALATRECPTGATSSTTTTSSKTSTTKTRTTPTTTTSSSTMTTSTNTTSAPTTATVTSTSSSSTTPSGGVGLGSTGGGGNGNGNGNGGAGGASSDVPGQP